MVHADEALRTGMETIKTKNWKGGGEGKGVGEERKKQDKEKAL